MNSLKSTFDGLKEGAKTIVYIVAIFLLGLAVGYFLEYKNMSAKLDAANNTIKIYEAKLITTDGEKERLLIENANLKNKEPEKIYIKGETETKYVYVQKEKESDSDVNITAKPMDIKLSYNGETFDLPMKSVSGSNIKNGTLFIGQQATGTLDVTDIVNREIAKTILEKDLEIDSLNYKIRQLQRKRTQDTVWGVLGGYVLGKGANTKK